jgi:hypothetical protein
MNIHYVSVIENIIDHADSTLSNSWFVARGNFKNVFKRMLRVPTFEVPTANFTFESLADSQRVELRSMGLMEDPANKNTFTGSPNSGDGRYCCGHLMIG